MGLEAATIAAIASVASAGVGAIGAYQQSQAAKSQARYQQQVAQNNAIIAQQNADRIRQQAQQAEDEHRDKIARTKGRARAVLAAQGLLVDDTADSTAQQLIQDIVTEGEYDILKIRDNYEQEARRAEIEGINYTAQAGLFGAKASAQSPFLSAAGTLFEGAGKVYGAGKGAGWWSGSPSGGGIVNSSATAGWKAWTVG